MDDNVIRQVNHAIFSFVDQKYGFAIDLHQSNDNGNCRVCDRFQVRVVRYMVVDFSCDFWRVVAI